MSSDRLVVMERRSTRAPLEHEIGSLTKLIAFYHRWLENPENRQRVTHALIVAYTSKLEQQLNVLSAENQNEIEQERTE